MVTTSPTEYYETRAAAQRRVADELATKANRIALVRKLTFATWVVLFLLGTMGYVAMGVAWGIASVTFVAFVILLAWHELLHRQNLIAKERLTIANVQLAKRERRWSDVPAQEVPVPRKSVCVSDDLDLFGHASLYQFLCRAHTPRGRELLRDWITHAANPDIIVARQTALRSLAPMTEFREELDLRGRVLSSSPAGPLHFVQWAESETWIERRPWLVVTARGAVVTFLVTIGLALAGVLSEPVAVAVCLAVLSINLVLSVFLVGAVHDIFDKVDSRHQDIQHYRTLFGMLSELPADVVFRPLKDLMRSDHSGANEAIAKLAKIMRWARMRHSSVVGIIHLGLQLVLLIDFHVLVILESWQRRHGPHVRGWFEALGELEALASLASLHYDHPDWAFPNVSSESSNYAAELLGHPLLPQPVRNSISVGPAGRFLLVSGSNMSGKSTLMRAIGLNAILAQAGAPVCATLLTLPPVEIATSMRIQDSLEDGISFFMAELQRLKSVVDQAARLEKSPDCTLLFLLDEILQGTNSAERHIAVQRVVHRLTEFGAMGAISTHDLELANSDDLAPICDPVHFRESFQADEQMTFDYVMRAGVATSTNALKLLEMVGID